MKRQGHPGDDAGRRGRDGTQPAVVRTANHQLPQLGKDKGGFSWAWPS